MQCSDLSPLLVAIGELLSRVKVDKETKKLICSRQTLDLDQLSTFMNATKRCDSQSASDLLVISCRFMPLLSLRRGLAACSVKFTVSRLSRIENLERLHIYVI